MRVYKSQHFGHILCHDKSIEDDYKRFDREQNQMVKFAPFKKGDKARLKDTTPSFAADTKQARIMSGTLTVKSCLYLPDNIWCVDFEEIPYAYMNDQVEKVDSKI